MAAVSLSPSPYQLSTMSTRRLPLASNPNAANSPFRNAAPACKQKRSYATIQREESYGQPPPAKKQMLASHHQDLLKTPPRQHSTQSSLEGRVFTRKSNTSQQSSFEKQCIAASEKQQAITKAEKNSEENLESIKTWQKHYRKLFPTFTFYFEGVPVDVRTKYSKLVVELGAREEKFFSNAVTHVITTRNIPPENPIPAEVETSSNNDSQSQHSQPQTINPSLLDRSSESTNAQAEFGTKAKFTFEAPSGRGFPSNVQDAEVRRHQNRSADVLHRARELGMKIWAFEKLQRITRVMLESDTGSQTHGHNTRSNNVPVNNTRAGHGADLSQLLRNERINGPSDRDPTVATKEMSLFKGPFIYIHDIDERQRPIMVREYAKVANKENGDWPQFRSVANGKCPFVEEREGDYSRREAEKEKEMIRLQKQQEKEKAMIPRTRAAAAFEATKMQPPKAVGGKRTLTELDDGSNRNVSVSSKQANPFAPNKSSLASRTAEASSTRSQNAFVSRAGAGRLFGGEPVASGLQPSNLTSAIRSQMISSTAAQPGAKAGTSKELHGLQRKVLEKNSGGPGSHGLASSHRMTDVSASARDDTTTRVVKKQDKLALIEEDFNPSETEENARKAENARRAKAVQKRKHEKRDPKPGYCENCQDKFEDFEEHVLSRKHRRFAEKAENWKELDSLLMQLERPLRDSPDQDYDY